jgi:porin
VKTFQKLRPITVALSIVIATSPCVVLAQSASEALTSPNSTEKILTYDAREKDKLLELQPLESLSERRDRFAENTGFYFGLDYNTLGFAATSNPNQNTTAGGVFRFMGTWDLLNRDAPNAGTLVFKIENRHGLSDVAPAAFGRAELGYVGGITGAFANEESSRVTNFYWQQKFANERGIAFVGWLDTTDYVDVYALPSPWTGFSNRAFQTGSGAIAGLNDGALGTMIGGFFTTNAYAVAGIVDANGVATDPFDGFNTLFGTGETFKTFEVGWTSDAEKLNYNAFFDNAHLTFWQIDALQDAGSKEGYGVAFSFSKAIGGVWLPFLRGGWAHGGNSAYEASVSVGLGYSQDLASGLLGVGLNWSRPNQDVHGSGIEDQLTAEVFQRFQVTEAIEVTPSVQLIHNPALNPDKETIGLLGLRVRAAF